MPVDERSPYLHMPLPHEANSLDQDLTRLRAAFNNLDSHAQSSDAARAALESELESKGRELAARGDALQETLESATAALVAHLAAENPHHLPLASRDAPGLAQVGQGLELDHGVVSVRPATDSTPGLMRPDGFTCAVSDVGVLYNTSMLCNTREVLTKSGTYIVRVCGWYRVILIGAGGAGTTRNRSAAARAGGKTTFGDLVALGGMGGDHTLNMGGYAGDVVVAYIWLSAGQIIPVTVGAGGMALNATDLAEFSKNYPGSFGFQLFIDPSRNYMGEGIGGNGGSNGTPYGGGGGGSGLYSDGYNIMTGVKRGGLGAGGGQNGVDSTATWGYGNRPVEPTILGGDGGDGAIILEFYDPNKPTA